MARKRHAGRTHHVKGYTRRGKGGKRIHVGGHRAKNPGGRRRRKHSRHRR